MPKAKVCPKKLGKELESLRGNKSLEELAESSGLSLEYLRNLEAGDVAKVRKRELKLLSKALSMPTPIVKFMGINPQDFEMSHLATAVQDAVKAVCKCQAESEEEDKKKKKKKKK